MNFIVFVLKSIIILPLVTLVLIVFNVFGLTNRQTNELNNGVTYNSAVIPELVLWMLVSVVHVNPMFIELYRTNPNVKTINVNALFYKFFDTETANILVNAIALHKLFDHTPYSVVDWMNKNTTSVRQKNKLTESTQRWLAMYGEEAVQVSKSKDVPDTLREQVRDILTLMLVIEKHYMPVGLDATA